jgi:hypothetical protein
VLRIQNYFLGPVSYFSSEFCANDIKTFVRYSFSKHTGTFQKKWYVIPDPDQNIFSSRILHDKRNVSYAFRSKVLVIVKKILDPENIHPGSGSQIRNTGLN